MAIYASLWEVCLAFDANKDPYWHRTMDSQPQKDPKWLQIVVNQSVTLCHAPRGSYEGCDTLCHACTKIVKTRKTQIQSDKRVTKGWQKDDKQVTNGALVAKGWHGWQRGDKRVTKGWQTGDKWCMSGKRVTWMTRRWQKGDKRVTKG